MSDNFCVLQRQHRMKQDLGAATDLVRKVKKSELDAYGCVSHQLKRFEN